MSIRCVALHPSSLRRTPGTPHSSGFERLASGAFYEPANFGYCCEHRTCEYIYQHPLGLRTLIIKDILLASYLLI